MIEHLGINTPYFGILVSLIPFVIATYFYKKTNGFFLLAPLFVSMVAGIAFLKLTGISYENYKIGGDIINFFLEPATICFAIPLYRKREVLKILVTNIWWYSCWYNYCLVINLSCCNNIPIWQSNYSIYATSSCNDSNCITCI